MNKNRLLVTLYDIFIINDMFSYNFRKDKYDAHGILHIRRCVLCWCQLLVESMRVSRCYLTPPMEQRWLILGKIKQTPIMIVIPNTNKMNFVIFLFNNSAQQLTYCKRGDQSNFYLIRNSLVAVFFPQTYFIYFICSHIYMNNEDSEYEFHIGLNDKLIAGIDVEVTVEDGSLNVYIAVCLMCCTYWRI